MCKPYHYAVVEAVASSTALMDLVIFTSHFFLERFRRKECEDHFRESNYKLISIDQVPKNATLLSSVWQMKRKRKPSTGEISKYKARMNVDGSKMTMDHRILK